MIKTAITSAIVPQARQGPFVFHDDLPGSIAKAAKLGFDAIEIFPPAASALNVRDLKKMTSDAGIKVAAIGTGAGFLIHKLTLIDPDSALRLKALEFVQRIIDIAAEFSAPAIIGSMQGRHPEGERNTSLNLLTLSLGSLAAHAKMYGQPLLYEPLNRYETNLFNRQADAADWLRQTKIENVKILADLFHMNIEEADVPTALRHVGDLLGHVHFVDSNRRAPGMGHTHFHPIVQALREIKFQGYLSAECFPLPTAEAAAQKTIETYKHLLSQNI
jgi:sugar phosphate isomerase/epimerase